MEIVEEGIIAGGGTSYLDVIPEVAKLLSETEGDEKTGVNIILKQANRGIKKDKFSAFEYGLYYIKQEEDSKKKKHHGRMSDFMFMN